jgi:hypothetical protein
MKESPRILEQKILIWVFSVIIAALISGRFAWNAGYERCFNNIGIIGTAEHTAAHDAVVACADQPCFYKGTNTGYSSVHVWTEGSVSMAEFPLANKPLQVIVGTERLTVAPPYGVVFGPGEDVYLVLSFGRHHGNVFILNKTEITKKGVYSGKE